MMKIAIALFLLVAAGCGAGRAVPLRTTTGAPIAGAYDWQAVRAAAIRALEAERFRIDQEQSNRLIASYARGRIGLQIALDYTPQGYQITYLSSEGLGHVQDERGTVLIGRRYERIVQGIERQLRAELERPAREAREQELALARAQRPVVYSPGVIAVQPGYGYGYAGVPSCEAALDAMGHPRSTHIFCTADVDPHCAQALIYGGNNATTLTFCRGVEPSCAVTYLQSGGHPTGLSRCRY
jgi:hypothetical protein